MPNLLGFRPTIVDYVICWFGRRDLSTWTAKIPSITVQVKEEPIQRRPYYLSDYPCGEKGLRNGVDIFCHTTRRVCEAALV